MRRIAVLLLVSVCAVSGCKKKGGGPNDPTPPPATELLISCPSALVVNEVKTQKQVVDYATPSHTGGVEPVKTTCTPASGSDFALGTTAVNCTATDARNPSQSAVCSFNVTLNAYVPPVPDLSVTKFMAFGDSITSGGSIGDPQTGNWPCPDYPGPASVPSFSRPKYEDPSQAYPAVVQRMLTQRYTRQTFTVTNRGQGGQSAKDDYLRFSSDFEAFQPEAVLLLQGILDVLGTEEPDAPIDALESNIRYAKAHGAKAVLVSTLLPVAGGWRICGNLENSTIRVANDLIRDVVSREGVYLVDSYARFVGRTEELIGEDGLHPTKAGEEVIAGAFFDAIKNNLELPLTSTSPSAFPRPQVQVRPPANGKPIGIRNGQ